MDDLEYTRLTYHPDASRLPTAPPWPRNAPEPLREQSAGFDAIVMTWTAAEAAILATLFTPGTPLVEWTPYTRNVEEFIPLVTGHRAPFNDSQPDMARYFHTLGLLYPCQIGKAKVLLFKSGLHFAYDGPAIPVKKLVAQLCADFQPSVFITTGTGGGIGRWTLLGEVVMGDSCRFHCTTQFKGKSWASAIYDSSTWPGYDIPQELFAVNAGKLPPGSRVDVKHGRILTTDNFSFDTSDNKPYCLQALGRVCEMGDAAVYSAIPQRIRRFAIRNCSDAGYVSVANGLEAAKKEAARVYTEYGAITTAGSVIACWGILDAIFNK